MHTAANVMQRLISLTDSASWLVIDVLRLDRFSEAANGTAPFQIGLSITGDRDPNLPSLVLISRFAA